MVNILCNRSKQEAGAETMTLPELHAAVAASSGPLEDELCARVWCAVHGESCRDIHRSEEIEGRLFIYGINDYWQLEPHERPDLNLDAALDLVRVRFPSARPKINQYPNGNWGCTLPSFGGLADEDAGPYYSATHKDRRLAIILALLKAMGA